MEQILDKAVELFRAGGPVMIPLAICSILSATIILERAIILRRKRLLRRDLRPYIDSLIGVGKVDEAIQIARNSNSVISELIIVGLENRSMPRSELKEVLEDAGRQQIPRLERFLGVLGTIASIAPLLGLLGTVIGMIDVFQVISDVGTGQAKQLSGGLSQALLTTAFGLIVAIPSLVFYNLFSDRAEGILLEMEGEVLRLLRLLSRANPSPPSALSAAPPPAEPVSEALP